MKHLLISLGLAAGCTLAQGSAVTTTDLATVQAFQQGLTLETFDSLSGRTPLTVSSFTSGTPVPAAAKVFDQVSGVRFSVGGTVGVDRPALYVLDSEVIELAASDAVLGSVDFEGASLFGNNAMIEVFFPTKIDSIGFWVGDGLSPVRVILATTNFAFSLEDEVTLEIVDVQPGQFVAFSRATAEIGGMKILSLGNLGFTVDDFSYGRTTSAALPTPAPALLLLPALVSAAWLRRRRSLPAA